MAARASIVVVGGGLAGMSAALEALHQTRNMAGVTVSLLEKEPRTGGNSAKASSGINGVLTRTQKVQGVVDSVEAFARDTIASGHGRSNETLVRKLTEDSTSAVAWLQEEFGLDLDVLAQLGGHSAARTHRRPEVGGRPQPVGWGIVSTLAERLAAHARDSGGRFRVQTGARVTRLLAAGGGGVGGAEYKAADGAEYKAADGVGGVEYETADGARHRVQASVVVLATGGFAGEGARPGFLREYAPQLAGLASTNGAFATGDGLRLASALGAALVDMDQVQVHPTGFVAPADPASATKFLAAEALRGEGGILLDAQGARFVDELDTRDQVTAAISRHCAAPHTRAQHPSTGAGVGPSAAAFLVLPQAAADRFGHGALGFYAKMGLVSRAADAAELAAALRVDAAALRRTLDAYDRARSAGGPDAHGKSVFPVAVGAAGAYFWGVVTPVTHYCMGGLRFDARTRVLRAADGAAIRGLLAAGEVTGGLHGANRLGGNSLLECVVFGREAGRQASQMLAL
ncbi:hypothetical protein GGF43_002236 [Coemansia sp. RSA 2618]|nr:hypothetical protein GGF43_002236 [Coemansia sp. RSA 2618]